VKRGSAADRLPSRALSQYRSMYSQKFNVSRIEYIA
jgi:hypothetical protein